MNIKKMLFCTMACLMLVGCSGSDDMTDPSDISADVLYLYDVKNGAIKAGEDWSDSGDEGFWLPVSDDVYAEFQDPERVGAWSPEQYFSASELKKGFKDGKIGTDTKFTWTVGDDGKINRLYEVNYYANNSVTG